ncbi:MULTISPECIES: hypothetical protein [unclassified Acinetobacter]|uniref:hypothetical protein n=1 Tax=unclassified Acinetobacter TaxID=196816 RepID=UPI00116BDD7D|nr:MULTISPECIES: hypothetical protein [unclassified Acinetobacter]QKQ70547.1 hypothetical protein E5Y90_10055 [Acinetobacter sp. 10FS3-1]TQR71350.1 hypothetical protein E2K52_02725 [Acinetobacter sp. RF14B]
MILDILEKYDQLTAAQKEIFAGYGLRQVKHFVEISLAKIEPVLPENTVVQGVNAAGKVQAVNPVTQQYYLWISDLQWQETAQPSAHIDLKEDFMAVWEVFKLAQYELIDLSHVHRDFLESQPA